jgi:pilus assembly protein CpaB
MNRRVIGAVAAVLLAAMGTFVLLVYVRSAEDRALAGEQVVNVYVVKEAIAQGTAGNALEGRIEVKKVPAKVEADGSLRSLEDITEKVAAVDLVPGEQLLASRFVNPEALTVQGQVDVPDGLHEVTVALEAQRALGGQVRPGDTVGVVSSFDPFEGNSPDPDTPAVKSPNSSHIILHKVLVTNVQNAGATSVAPPGDGEEAAGSAAAPSGNVFVTLAVDAPSVERLVFTAEHGFIWLTQEPEDAPEDGTKIQTRSSVYQ